MAMTMTHTHTHQNSSQPLEPENSSYKSYAEALAHCQQGAYEADEIVKVVVEKNLIFREQIRLNPVFDLGAIRTLIGVALTGAKGSLNVIDFGGAGGYHYTIARTALDPTVALRWNVVETPAMASEAERLKNLELNFFSNIDDATSDLNEVDIVFSSGALHCTPDPSSFLDGLLSIGARRLFITRTAFNDESEILVNVQKSFLSSNGPGPLPSGFVDKAVFYPNVFIPFNGVLSAIQRQYNIRFAILEDRNAYRVGNKGIHMYGIFCTRKV